MKMTWEEANAEAVRRWGSSGWAIVSPHALAISRFKVGSDTGVHGRGATYELAFADADRREGR